MRFTISIALSLFAVVLTNAQIIEFDMPQRLNDKVNSSAEEIYPLLAPDGKSLFFTRFLHSDNIAGKYAGSDIWISRLDEKTLEWQTPTNKDLRFNSRWNNSVIGMNKKGDLIYLLDTRDGTQTKGILFSKKVNGNWGTPEVVPVPDLSPDGFLGLYVAPDYDVIIISMKGPKTMGEEDLYVSLKDAEGDWSEPKNLGSAVNTSGFEMSPFLSADKTRLYFASNGHAGFGDADLFYTDRLYNSWDTWSAPTNLGEKVNSPAFDAYFSMYGDSIAYFSSNRGAELANIYSVRLTSKDIAGGANKRLLSKSEVEEIFGKNIITEYQFDITQSTLSSQQQEMFYYLIKKLQPRSDLSVQLITLKGDNIDRQSLQLQTILEYIRALGLEPSRVSVVESKQSYKPGDKIKIEMIFLKQNNP